MGSIAPNEGAFVEEVGDALVARRGAEADRDELPPRLSTTAGTSPYPTRPAIDPTGPSQSVERLVNQSQPPPSVTVTPFRSAFARKKGVSPGASDGYLNLILPPPEWKII